MNKRYKPENLARNGPGSLRRSWRYSLRIRTAIHSRDSTANSEYIKGDESSIGINDILVG
jgi:hypothetical protein